MKKEFEGIVYNDDRMYVLYLCKCTITETRDHIVSTIHHVDIPDNYIWSVALFRNNDRYTGIKVDHFKSEEEAKEFILKVEPLVPLISLHGKAPSQPLSYEKLVEWKDTNGFVEYDYRKMFLPDSINPFESIYKLKKKALMASEGVSA